MFSLSLNGYDRSADKTTPQDPGVAIGPAATQRLALTLLPPPTDATPCLRHMSMIEGGFLVIEDYVCLIATCKSTQYYYSKNVFWVQYAKRNKIELPEGCTSAYAVVKQHRQNETRKLRKCLKLDFGTYPKLITYIDVNIEKLCAYEFVPEYFDIAKRIKKTPGDTIVFISRTADPSLRSQYMDIFPTLDLSILSEAACRYLLYIVLRRDNNYDNPNFEVAKALIRVKPSLISQTLVDICIRHRFIELIDEILKYESDLNQDPEIITLALECCYPEIVVTYMYLSDMLREKQEEILKHACIRGYDEIVDIGINKGWSIDGRFAAIALRHGSMAIFDMLMRQKIDNPNARNEIYFVAASMGQLETIEKCRLLGWKLTQETVNQCAYEAAKNGHTDVVKYFSRLRLPIDNTYRTLSLYEAALLGDLEMIECLRPELLDPERRADVLIGALRNGDDYVIERILKSGPYAVTENNRAPIIKVATQRHRLEIVTYCDPKKLSLDERYEALDIALKKADLGIMNILWESGPISPKSRRKLFNWACQFSCAAMIQIVSRANVIFANREYAYERAALNGRVDLLDALNVEMSGEERAKILSVVVRDAIKKDNMLQFRDIYKKVESGGPVCWRTLIYKLIEENIAFKTFFEVFSKVPLKEIPNLNDHIEYIRKNIGSLYGLDEEREILSPDQIATQEAAIETLLKRLTELEQLAI